MADILKPMYGSVWANAGERLAPPEAKVNNGWIQEMMPFQYENWIQHRQDITLTYLLQKGVGEWSAEQEYILNKSVVTYQGNIYMATATTTNVAPTVSTSWKRINTIATADGVISITGGGTGATNASSARTNLGLGTIATQNAGAVNITGGTLTGVTISGSFTGGVTGNAETATKLETARTFTLTGGATSTPVTFDGSANALINVLTLDATKLTGVATVSTTGNAATSTVLQTPRTITLSGAATGTPTEFNGGSDISIPIVSLNATDLLTGTVPTGRLGNAVTKTSATGSAQIPVGTTSERDTSPVLGSFRSNSSNNFIPEYWNGASWIAMTGSDLGGLIGPNPTQVSTNAMNDAKYQTLTAASAQGVFDRDRANHTGMQAISTITNLQNTIDLKAIDNHPNLLSNGGLEFGFDGWSTSNTTSFSFSPFWGSSAIASGLSGAVSYVATSPKVECAGNTEYTVSGDSLLLGTNVVNPVTYYDIQVFDSTGALILDGGQTAINTTHDFSDTPERRLSHKISTTTPANAASLRVRFIAQTTSGTGILAGFRRVKVERGNSVTAWSDEASLSLIRQKLFGKVSDNVILPPSTDLNTVITGGLYRVNIPVNAPDNLPSSGQYGQLIVSRGSNTIWQLLSGHSTGATYSRVGVGSSDEGPYTFTDWAETLTDKNIKTINGQSIFGTGNIIASDAPIGTSYTGVTPPETGVWLEASNLYLKSSYPELAAAVGDVPTIGPWSQRSLTVLNVSDIAYGNDIYVAVGRTNEGVYQAASSPDTITWTSRTITSCDTCAFGNGVFVALGASGTASTSTNGISWTARVIQSAVWKKVIFVETLGLFIAVATAGAISTSPDGITWTARANGGVSNFAGVAYGDGKVIAWGNNGQIVTSLNGIFWSQAAQLNGLGSVAGMAYGNGTWVAVGSFGGATSRDLTAWTLQFMTLSKDGAYGYTCVDYFNGKFIAMGGAVINNQLFSDSADGTNWKSQIVLSGIYNVVKKINNIIIAGGSNIKTMPAFAYDTTTQFYVPGPESSIGLKSWMKAKL